MPEPTDRFPTPLPDVFGLAEPVWHDSSRPGEWRGVRREVAGQGQGGNFCRSHVPTRSSLSLFFNRMLDHRETRGAAFGQSAESPCQEARSAGLRVGLSRIAFASFSLSLFR